MTNPTGTLKAADLNRNHLGKIISVKHGDAAVSDLLCGISHQGDVIEDHQIMQEVPDRHIGRIATVLTFASAGEMHVPGNADVTAI